MKDCHYPNDARSFLKKKRSGGWRARNLTNPGLGEQIFTVATPQNLHYEIAKSRAPLLMEGPAVVEVPKLVRAGDVRVDNDLELAF